MKRSGKARVLIIDDHPLVRLGFRAMLEGEPDLAVCGDTGSCSEALELAKKLRPDVAVVDLSMEDCSGLDLVRRLHAHHPEIRLLVYSMHDEALYAPRVINAGALGFVNKQETQQTVFEALRTVLSGDIYLGAAMQQQEAAARRHSMSSVESLTDRELEVFSLLGHGLKTSEIAGKLHLSVKTVETHQDKIRRKLNLASGREVIRAAVQWVHGDG